MYSFDDSCRYGEKKLQRILLTESESQPSFSAALTNQMGGGEEEDTKTEDAEPPRGSRDVRQELSALRDRLDLHASFEQRVTRSQFQQWWLSEERAARLRKDSFQFCPPRCASGSAVCRGVSRRNQHGFLGEGRARKPNRGLFAPAKSRQECWLRALWWCRSAGPR